MAKQKSKIDEWLREYMTPEEVAKLRGEPLPEPTPIAEPEENQGYTLRALREMHHLTQKDMSERMNTVQPEVARAEKRRDLKASTLRRYIHALGGELELNAVFDGTRYPLDLNPTAFHTLHRKLGELLPGPDNLQLRRRLAQLAKSFVLEGHPAHIVVEKVRSYLGYRFEGTEHGDSVFLEMQRALEEDLGETK